MLWSSRHRKSFNSCNFLLLSLVTLPGDSLIAFSFSLMPTLVGVCAAVLPDKTTALGSPVCLMSGPRIMLANVLAASTRASPNDCFFCFFGPTPVIAGRSGGSSVLSWLPDMIERPYNLNWGNEYFSPCFSFNSVTIPSTSASIC